MASVIKDSCTACGICEPLCPTESILPGPKRFAIDADTCTSCQACVSSCPEGAIKPEKKGK